MMKQRIIMVIIAIVAIGLLFGAWQVYEFWNVKPKQGTTNPPEILKQIKASAAAGKTTTSGDFHIGSSSQEIIAEWEEPPSKGWQKNGKLSYLSYERLDYEKTPIFRIQSNKVLMIDCYNRSYWEITHQDMLDTLGKPVKEHHQMHEGEDYMVSTYKAGKYTLEIFFHDDIDKKIIKPSDRISFIRVK